MKNINLYIYISEQNFFLFFYTFSLNQLTIWSKQYELINIYDHKKITSSRIRFVQSADARTMIFVTDIFLIANSFFLIRGLANDSSTLQERTCKSASCTNTSIKSVPVRPRTEID